MNSGIYKISFPGTDHFYIGSSVNLPDRKSIHLCHLNKQDHCNKHLQSVFNKHGSFVFDILELCEADDLIGREQYYIDLLKPDLNKCATAGSTVGYKHTEETMRFMIAFNRAQSKKASWRKGVSKGWFKKGKRVLTEEEKKRYVKIAAKNRGRKHNEASKLKMSASAIKRGPNRNSDIKVWGKMGIEASKKPIMQMDKNGALIAVFESATDAVRQFNIKNITHLTDCCKGKQQTYKGYTWRFITKVKQRA